jgi:K+-sensing histidine kinase KdpD
MQDVSCLYPTISPTLNPEDPVFEMFSLVAPDGMRARRGFGVGLALARGLVELHGGKLTAHCAGLVQGSEFIVKLPLSRSAGPSRQPVTGAPTSSPPAKRRAPV